MGLQAHIANNKTALKSVGVGSGAMPFFTPVVQPKLSVNQPGDMYEQEADTMADRVMRMTDVSSPQSFFKPSHLPVHRKCQHCEEEEKRAQRKESGIAPTIDRSTENYISNLSGGRALDKKERDFFEPRMGYDLSAVRLHYDDNAHRSARSINALAYTHGSNIVFGAGQYQPGTDSGKRLMAHELTHTIQQTGNVQQMVQREPAKANVDPTQASVCTMHFKQGTTEFTDAKEFAHCMQVIKAYLKANSNGKVELHGFASEEGTPDFNMDLSKRRAAIVWLLLKQGHTDTSRITTEGHGADTTNTTIPNEQRRRVEVVNFETMDFTQDPAADVIEAKPTCPVPCTTPITLYKDTVNCGSGDDFLNADKLSGPSGVKNNLKVAPFVPLPESILLDDMIIGPTGLQTLAGTPGRDAANHFFGGSGATVTHDVTTPIGKAADKSATFATTSASVEAAFHKLITSMAGTPAVNKCSTLKLTSGDVPKVDFPFPKSLSGVSGGDLMLKAIIGGTHGIEVTLTGFTVDCNSRTYTATIQFNVCDNFGVDETDMYSDSLISFWVLQHMHTGHAAFINDILLSRTFTKSF